MSYIQLVHPRTGTSDGAGWCLRFTQSVFGAPAMYPSATSAANATGLRNFSRSMPNASVAVWFDHWGTYQGLYANWGHVVAWVPGRGFLSAPASGFGQLWLPSLEAVERTFNAKYRFWTLDINTLLVAQVSPPVEDSKDYSPGYHSRLNKGREAMIYIYDKDSTKHKDGRRWGVFVLGQKGSWWEFRGEVAGPMLEKQLGPAMGVSAATFDGRKAVHQ